MLLIGGAPDYCGSGPWFESDISHSGKTLRTGRVTVYTIKSRGKEGNLHLRQTKVKRKGLWHCWLKGSIWLWLSNTVFSWFKLFWSPAKQKKIYSISPRYSNFKKLRRVNDTAPGWSRSRENNISKKKPPCHLQRGVFESLTPRYGFRILRHALIFLAFASVTPKMLRVPSSRT